MYTLCSYLYILFLDMCVLFSFVLLQGSIYCGGGGGGVGVEESSPLSMLASPKNIYPTAI